jgi:hypothetical protein
MAVIAEPPQTGQKVGCAENPRSEGTGEECLVDLETGLESQVLDSLSPGHELGETPDAMNRNA